MDITSPNTAGIEVNAIEASECGQAAWVQMYAAKGTAKADFMDKAAEYGQPITGAENFGSFGNLTGRRVAVILNY